MTKTWTQNEQQKILKKNYNMTNLDKTVPIFIFWKQLNQILPTFFSTYRPLLKTQRQHSLTSSTRKEQVSTTKRQGLHESQFTNSSLETKSFGSCQLSTHHVLAFQFSLFKFNHVWIFDEILYSKRPCQIFMQGDSDFRS